MILPQLPVAEKTDARYLPLVGPQRREVSNRGVMTGARQPWQPQWPSQQWLLIVDSEAELQERSPRSPGERWLQSPTVVVSSVAIH